MPMFFYQLYTFTHKDERSKKKENESTVAGIDVEALIRDSVASSDIRWSTNDRMSSSNVDMLNTNSQVISPDSPASIDVTYKTPTTENMTS